LLHRSEAPGSADIVAKGFLASERATLIQDQALTRLSQLEQKNLEYQWPGPKGLHYRAGAGA
jgi:hypothetical protein